MASAQLKPASRSDLQFDHRHYYETASRLYSIGADEHNAALLDDALQQALYAYELKPSYVAGLNLLARIEMQRRQFRAAEHWVETGLKLKPESASLLYSAGHIALAQHQLERAEAYFSQSTAISRVATKAVNSLAHVKFLQGDYVEAFRHYRELAKTQYRDKQIRSQLFESASKVVADFYSEELEQDVLRYLDFNDVDFGQMRSLATSLLKHKLRLSEAGCPLEMDTLLAEPLLQKCLTRFYFCDPLMERLLITLRQSILFSCSRQLSVRAQELPLVAALAQQCHLNESVWYTSTQEDMLVEQLSLLVEKMLGLADIKASDLFPAISLVLMYRPLNTCSFRDQLLSKRLQWPDTLDAFIRAQLNEYKQLNRIRQQLPALSAGKNAVSEKVKAQYDEHPYPRWTDIGYNQPANYRESLQAAFPRADLSALPHDQAQVLVAGCGTGRHAIRLALYFSPLTLTALDLSHTALAYASLQASKRQVSDIEFIQGDILQSKKLQKTFDVIECSGVLHHMENPHAGLNALASILKPGGVMKIALYSRTARQSIARLRQLWGNQCPSKVSDMRLIREAILQKSLAGDWSDIYNSPDFYSLSACRDLLFHQQEHQFDVSELEAFCAGAGLNWLGMLPPPGFQGLLALTGKAAWQLTTAEWSALEQKNPALFAGMYQFYVQKPVTAAS
ncbi:methyltransferase domain-containing protein [Thalassolituus sp. LLYu03]|uniref:methyltransferase domain-containing protein n=1 Tax=Thalassolituus sp. LLYu03 TaxID=3421656 RepID=UPI003D293BBE